MGKQVSAWKNAPIVQESNGVDTIEEPKWKSAPVVEEPVKKKDNTLNAPESPKPSTVPGSEKSQGASEPPTVPFGSLTVNPNDPLGIGETIAKTVYSGFAHQLPGAIASLPALNTQTYEQHLLASLPSSKKGAIAGKLFRENLGNLEFGKAFSIGDKEIQEQYLKDLKNEIGENKFNENKSAYQKELAKKTLQSAESYKKFNKQRSALLGDVPQSYKDIKDATGAAKYLSYQFGQAIPTMVAAGLAPGVGSYVLEATDSYNENLDETAKALGKTTKQVVEQGLDKPAKEIASNVGLINAALDVGGLGSLFGAARKLFTKEAAKEIARRSLTKKLVTAIGDPLVIEPITETLQEANTAFSSQKAAGKTDAEAFQFVKENYPRLIDSFIGGLTGSAGAKVILSTHQTISNAKDQITSTGDIKSIEDHAAKIIESVKQAPEEGVTNAIQEQSPSSVLQHPQEGVGETGSGRGRMEPIIEGKEIAGTREQNESITSPEKKEESLNIQPNENDTGIRRTVSETGIQTEQGKGNQESGSPSGINREEEVRSEENGGVRREWQETTQQINQNETEQLSRGSEQERSGIEQKDAENITRQVQESIPKTEGAQTSTREIKKEQDKALESYAKSNGSYIEDVKETLGEKLAGGIEQDVYLNKEGDKVIKINGLSNHASWDEFWDRLNLQNTLFPNTGYELKGFTKVGGRLSAVLEQPYIEGSPVPRHELIEDLAKRGFYQIHPEGSLGENQFYNPELGVRLSDVHGENVIKDQDGNIRYIDPMLDRENPFVDEESQKYFNEQKTKHSEEPPTQAPTEPLTEEQPQGKQFALAKRIEASDVQEPVKEGVRKESTYTPKGLNITEAEAQKVIDENGLDATEAMVKDSSNNLTPDQRVVISGKLYENYVDNGQNVKAVDIAIWAENLLMQAGRAANAGKFWKMITSSGEDQIVLAIERQQQRNQQSALTDIDRSKTKAQLEAEFRRLVEEKVQSTVESRLEATKLITKEKRKEIGDFFDKLKIDTKNNIASAALLPIGVLPHVWNATVDVIKQAVLTGADVANAIQAGIDHIKANQKEPFDEQKFRDEFTPEVQKIMPRKKIKASDIDPSKIQTPKILGKKKIDFINKVVDAFNKDELTDKKFDEIYASKLGFREFTSEDRAKIRKLAKTIAESEKFDDQLRALPADQFTRENIEKMKGLHDAARQANKDLQEYSQAPADVWDTLIAVMQANLMSSMSLVSNVWYNLTYSPLRATSTGVASMLDYGMSKMAKIGLMPKFLEDRTIDYVAVQKGYAEGGWNGTLEGLKQLKTGTQADEANLREIHSKFNPSKAIDRWANEDRTLKQKANDYIEGTIGWEAEAMFRLLNLGDKPFKRAAEWARANEIASLKGLKGKEREKFLLLPDAESEAEIVKAGKEATFQQDTKGGKIVQNALSQFLNFVSTVPVIGGPAKVIIKSQIPFVKTPMNLIIETIQYAAPPATLATGVYQIAKGNKRSGSILVGKAVVGSMLWNAATMLFLKGLLTGDDDKDKKKRDFQLDKTPPPNSLNTSAISRGLAFGDWSIQDGDTWVSYSKMGVAGICLDNYANIYKERIANHGDISGGPETFLQDMMQSAPRVASSTIEQSFLQGTSSALEALKSGDDKTMNNWLVKTTESVGSILYPNTIATFAKASDDYLRDTNDPEFLGRLKNVYKAKMFMGDELPPKVSLWGDKVTGNPEGRSKYAYYLFDPSKFKDISTNDFRYKLYNAFKSDYDADWLPSIPQRNITVDGEKRQLTPKEYAELSINVGKERAALTSAYINSTDQINKNELKMRYDEGYELGKEKFMIDHGMNVTYKFRKPLELRSLTKKLNKQKVKF